MTELKLIFLGTGSARPTPRRGCASVALVYGAHSVLFDCGEGAQLQALRAGYKTRGLVAVCISHFHGDHINGLPGFLGTMGLNGHRDRVTIASPPGINRYFDVLRRLNILRPSFGLDLVSNEEPEVFANDAFYVETCPLDHRIPTWGFQFVERDLVGRFDVDRAREMGLPPGPAYGRLQRGEVVTLDDGTKIRPEDVLGPTRRGRRVAYICDSRPTDEVVDFVRGADILIHDSTYLHEHQDQAVERGHSTVREAAEVARAAGVGRLILTHVSPKHTRGRELVDEARATFETSDLAEDLREFELPMPR